MEPCKKPYESIFRRLLFGVLCLLTIVISSTFVYGANTSGVLVYVTGEDVAGYNSGLIDSLSDSLSAASGETAALPQQQGTSAADSSDIVASDPIAVNPNEVVAAEFSDEPGALPAYATASEEVGAYSDNAIKIKVTKYTGNEIVYFAADVILSSAEHLKTAFAFGLFEGQARQYTSAMAASNGAILAVNGDYYNFREDGIVIRNGKLYRNNPSDRDMLVIDQNGDFSTQPETSADAKALAASHVLQTFTFGPVLVREGSILTVPNNYFLLGKSAAPRTAIGQVGALHYMFVVVDGRQEGYSTGVNIGGLAQIMASLHCTSAYNLDGGGSSTMVFQNEVVNRPTNTGAVKERSVSDIIYIG